MFLCLNCHHLEWLQRMGILGKQSKNTACVFRANNIYFDRLRAVQFFFENSAEKS